jgi:hypothetical protein
LSDFGQIIQEKREEKKHIFVALKHMTNVIKMYLNSIISDGQKQSHIPKKEYGWAKLEMLPLSSLCMED